MTNLELIKKHDEDTMFCSITSHMRSASSTYKEIISLGDKIIPDILKYLKDKKSGMTIILLLMDIVKESPYQPDVNGCELYNVADARKSWIEWGIKKGYTNATVAPAK